MKQTKFLRTLFFLTVLLLCGAKLHAQQPYAVLSEDNTTLTFYYDKKKLIRNGMDVGPFTDNKHSGWYYKTIKLTTVVFDDSFADCTSITSTAYWFSGCFKLTTIMGIRNLHTQNVTDMSYMFDLCANLSSLDLTNFDTRKVTNMRGMFCDCSSLTSLDVTNFNTQNVTNMRGMFWGCSSLTSLDVTNFDTKNVTDMSHMFSSCSSLTSLDVTNFDTKNVTDMSHMFSICSKLTSLDVTNFDTKNVTYINSMFYYCRSLTSIDVTNFNTQNVTNMGGMFYYCNSLTSIDVTNFDTKNVTNMSHMFSSCSSLTSLDVTNFDTKNVTNMGDMFSYCSNLTRLDVTNFNTQNVTSMIELFCGCSSLTSLDVTNFDTKNVTDMSHMFSSCSSLTSLDVTNFDTQNVTSMYGMFSRCSSLTSLDLTNFNTQNVVDMYLMFSYCSNLTSLDLTNFNTQNVTTMWSMFKDCSSLTSLDVTKFNTQNVTEMMHMFRGCSSLTSLDLTNFNTQNVTNMSIMFSECNNLALVRMGENMSVIKSEAFNNCPKLTDVYCLAITVPNADSGAFDKDYIEANTTLHVPAESISDYQTTVPWSYFKNIVALGETMTNLADGEVYGNESVVNNIDICYTRTFNDTNWQALYVPFAMSYDDWKDDFDVAKINNFHEYDDDENGTVDRTILEILYVESGCTQPNTPYMIRAKEAGMKVITMDNAMLDATKENSIDCSSERTKYTLTGTYSGLSGDEMYANGYYALDEGSLIRPSSASMPLGTFRWYLKAESSIGSDAALAQTISIHVAGEEEDTGTTGITGGVTVDGPVEHYNLEGVKVSPSEAKGIVIVRKTDGSMRKVIRK